MLATHIRSTLTKVAGAFALCAAASAQTTSFYADDPVPNPTYATILSGAALRATGFGDDYQLVGDGLLVEGDDSSARFEGVIARASDPDRRFRVQLRLAGYAAPGDSGYGWIAPYKKLKSAAYSQAGGPVATSSWRYFKYAWGTLEGEGDFEGARVALYQPCGVDFQIGDGANNRNVEEGASTRLWFKTWKQPTTGVCLPWSFQCGDLQVDLDGDDEFCAKEIKSNPAVAYGTFNHAFYLPGIGTDFVFTQPARFVERIDGSARLTGIVARKSNPTQGFDVAFDFTGRVSPGDASYPPAGSPMLELQPHAYVALGGPIDPATWRYYQTTSGVLTGRNAYSGAVLSMVRYGPSFQVGRGANGLNLKQGASGWLDVTIASQPHAGPALAMTDVGDINIEIYEDCDLCADEAVADQAVSNSSSAHAFWLPAIGTDFIWETQGSFEQHSDGTATLTGVLKRASNSNWKFAATVNFSQRINPGDAGYPPSGSPKLELKPAAYLANGGPIDPATWHYYQQTDGLLLGQGSLAGMQVKLTRHGPSFQVGTGANGKNLHYGASGWLNVKVLKNPPGKCFQTCSYGDINIDLGECP